MSFSEIIAKLRVWGIPGVADFVTKKIHWRQMAHEFRRLSRLDEGATPERGITLIGDFKNGSSNSKTCSPWWSCGSPGGWTAFSRTRYTICCAYKRNHNKDKGTG